MATLSELKTKISGRSRLNRFRINLPTPTGTIEEVMIKASALPGRTIEPIEVKHKGATIKLGGDPKYNDWKVEVYGEDYAEYQKFFNWMDIVGETVLNTRGDPLTYKVDGVKVEQLGTQNEVIATAWLYGVFPTDVGDISYDHEQGELVKFEVTFSLDSIRFEAGA
jgi:hypothetical protein